MPPPAEYRAAAPLVPSAPAAASVLVGAVPDAREPGRRLPPPVLGRVPADATNSEKSASFRSALEVRMCCSSSSCADSVASGPAAASMSPISANARCSGVCSPCERRPPPTRAPPAPGVVPPRLVPPPPPLVATVLTSGEEGSGGAGAGDGEVVTPRPAPVAAAAAAAAVALGGDAPLLLPVPVPPLPRGGGAGGLRAGGAAATAPGGGAPRAPPPSGVGIARGDDGSDQERLAGCQCVTCEARRDDPQYHTQRRRRRRGRRALMHTAGVASLGASPVV